jgi:mRNA interferase MazF
MTSEGGGAAWFTFGEVVLVSFLFTNQAGSKQRPAVAVSSVAYARERPDVILMPITSQFRVGGTVGQWGDVYLSNWQSAGLLKPSAVKPIIATFERRLVLRVLGNLVQADREALAATLTSIIGPPTISAT